MRFEKVEGEARRRFAATAACGECDKAGRVLFAARVGKGPNVNIDHEDGKIASSGELARTVASDLGR